MSLKYFGERWDAPMLDNAVEVPLPGPDEHCVHCDEGFELGDCGYRYANGPPTHRECGLRAVVGGLNHLKRKCSCCGGFDPPDPEGLSKRDAARLSWDFVDQLKEAQDKAKLSS